MQRLISMAAIIVLSIILFTGISEAYNISYVGTSQTNPGIPPQQNTLEHNYYYWWKITDTGLRDKIKKGDILTNAYLVFKGLQDNSGDKNNRLWMALADSLPLYTEGGVVYPTGLQGNMNSYSDYAHQSANVYLNNVFDPTSGTAPASAVDLGYYNDPNTQTANHNIDVLTKINFTSNVNKFMDYVKEDGVFYVGFDPDCEWHFQDLTMNFRVTPAVVPEPSSLVLFSAGLFGLGFFSIRKKNVG